LGLPRCHKSVTGTFSDGSDSFLSTDTIYKAVNKIERDE
jgi:hypothetical protein